MEQNAMALGQKYYQLMGEKKEEEIAKMLHSDVEFYGPLATLKGEKAVIRAVSHFMNAIESLTIRAKFGESDQAMIVYEVDMPGISSEFPGASWLTFRDGLIVRIQLFYDGSRLIKKAQEIFSK